MLADSIKNCKILSVTSKCKITGKKSDLLMKLFKIKSDENEIQQIYFSFLLILPKNPNHGDCFISI